MDSNLYEIDFELERDDPLTSFDDKQNIDKKDGVSLNSLLYGTRNNDKKNEEEEEKSYSRTISKTVSIESSEEDQTPTPIYQSSQIGNISNRNKPDHFFYAPRSMKPSPAKLRPSRLLLLKTENSNRREFPMVISSIRKRSLRTSLAVERKIKLETIKEEMSDDSELDLIIENDLVYENPMKKRKLN